MTILISFRFDDPSLTSDHQLEKSILSIFEKNNINLCVGVIPFYENEEATKPFNKEAASHLIEAKQKGSIEIALHGYSHTKRRSTTTGATSEFFGLPEEQQARLIYEGKRQLEDVFGGINGFIPPWNTYDAVTEKILKEQGFTFISASCDSPQPSQYYLPNLYRTVPVHHARETIQQAFLFEDLSPVINILFHHYDFEEYKTENAVINLTKLDELLEWVKSQNGLSIVPLSEAAKSLQKYTPQKNLNYYQWRKRLPVRFRWRFPVDLIFLSPNWKIVMKVIGLQIMQILKNHSSKSVSS